MTQTKSMENKKPQMNKRGYHLMSETPVWKALLKMALPALIFMLVIGSYMFIDEILAINLVSKHHDGIAGIVGPITDRDVIAKTTVRASLGAFGPINPFLNAVTMLFGMGIATRVSINMGAKKMDRAKNTLKTGTMIGLSIALIMVPILLLTIKSWMRTQVPAKFADEIADRAYGYGAIIISLFPISMFNQILSSMFRTEGRNKAIMIPYVASILINIFLDWVFMGPGKMGIEGGALATMVSTLFVTMVFIVIILKNNQSIITFKNMFGRKFKVLSIVGILLVGMAPFMRNFASSITGSIEASVIKDISHHLYGPNSMKMTSMLNGVFPVFLLFFPMMFAFAQAGRPIASFNFGAGNIKRVKQTYFWVVVYATITAIIIYFVSAYGLANILLDWLGMPSVGRQGTIKMLKIMMSSVLIFGLVIAAMVLLGSTDRIWLSLFVSMLRGVILFFPFIYGFKALALDNLSNEFLFWWFFPAIAFTAAFIATGVAVTILFHIDKKVKTLDERLNVIYAKWDNRKAK